VYSGSSPPKLQPYFSLDVPVGAFPGEFGSSPQKINFPGRALGPNAPGKNQPSAFPDGRYVLQQISCGALVIQGAAVHNKFPFQLGLPYIVPVVVVLKVQITAAHLITIDGPSYDYLYVKAIASHKTPAEVISGMVQERIATSA
jgi:hypothetical protein